MEGHSPKRSSRWRPWWPSFESNLSRETAWLDGVRGFAALLVMSNHFSAEWLRDMVGAPFGAEVLIDFTADGVWNYPKGTRLWDIWRLPILRLLVCSGGGQVAVFFVLSGFVLSWRPLNMIRAGNYDKMAQTLGSSMVCRWFRLFLPCIAVGAIYLIQEKWIGDYHGFWPAIKELWAFISEMERWSRPSPVGWVNEWWAVNPYAYVMWTIPLEWGGSMFIYVTMLAMGRISSCPRRTFIVLLNSLHLSYAAIWSMWLFGFGILLADYVQQAGGFERLTQRTSRSASVLWCILLPIGLFFVGYEQNSDKYSTPGYRWVDKLPIPSSYDQPTTNPARFWLGWGAILLVASSCHLRFMRRFYESYVIQYLGRVSFMLYLIHMMYVVNLSGPLKRGLYGRFAEEGHDSAPGTNFITTPLMKFTIYVISWLTCARPTMITAHLLELFVDRPCTKVGKMVDDKLLNGFPDVRWTTRKEEQALGSPEEDRLLGFMDVELGEMPDE